MKRRFLAFGVALCAVGVAVSARAQDSPSAVQVIREVKHDVSGPLVELQRMTPAEPFVFSPRILKVLPVGGSKEAPQYLTVDTALQQNPLPLVSASVGLNFEGLGLGQYGFMLQVAPPDTEGTIGTTQYVQWVNLEFAVFDKTTGALLAGPTPGKALWAGFGGGCQNNNNGDPIVQFDKIAKRWIFTQFSITGTPFLQCVAVSTTDDATGSYNRYSFSFGNQFPDYPKVGVWPDAYYMNFNMFNASGTSFLGPRPCAMDRAAMLAGAAATMVCFQQSAVFGSLLPSDMDGTIQPAAGEPAFFIDYGTNSLLLWKFHVDFATPANSTFTGPTTIPVASFSPLCGGGTCVVQPGTSQRLDSLADRLMYRLAYRKFADGHESLFVNHAITTGERWYELRDPNGTPTVFQQGTVAPDSSTRWMGSIAADQSGDIALGYSVSSSSVFPSVFFTGRVPSDPLGSMETEQVIVNGTGSQTGGLNRWGDYSDMSVDPVDDCTFWYTQEYIKSNGSLNWNTRIANFKFPNCGGGGGGGPAVTLSAAKVPFTKTSIGQTSPAKSVTLTNTGDATLNISSTTISGDFAIQSNTCGSSVNAGASCVVTMTFKPAAKGTRKGTLAFTDNAAGSPHTVALQGTGMSLALSPTALDFGTVTVGQSSSPQSITVTNGGSAAVTFTGFALAGAAAGDYTISGNTCGATINAGASCAVSIVFHPTALKKRNAKLNVGNNGGGTPVTATLTGKGN